MIPLTHPTLPIRNSPKEANRAAEVIAEEAEELVEEAKELAETVVEAATCCSIHTSIHLFVATILFSNWRWTIGLDIKELQTSMNSFQALIFSCHDDHFAPGSATCFQ